MPGNGTGRTFQAQEVEGSYLALCFVQLGDTMKSLYRVKRGEGYAFTIKFYSMNNLVCLFFSLVRISSLNIYIFLYFPVDAVAQGVEPFFRPRTILF